MSVTIYHNPHCSYSRDTLSLLRQRGIEPNIVDYLTNPPSIIKLKRILKLLGIQPRDLLRKKEPLYDTLGLNDETIADDILIEMMREHPILMERPIVVTEHKAALGRPPENVLTIL